MTTFTSKDMKPDCANKSFTVIAFHPQTSAMPVDHGFHDSEAQPGPAEFPRPVAVGTVEPFGQARQVHRVDAGPLVDDLHPCRRPPDGRVKL